jgi:hypothetical protein
MENLRKNTSAKEMFSKVTKAICIVKITQSLFRKLMEVKFYMR